MIRLANQTGIGGKIMKKTAFSISLALALAACGGGELDDPTEATLPDEEAAADAGDEGEAADGEDETTDAEAETKADKEDDAASQAATDGTTIPARFHGRWASRAEGCADSGLDDGITDITAKNIGYYESDIDVTKVRSEGNDVLVEGKLNEPGDLPRDSVTERLSLVSTADGERLHVTDGTKPKQPSEYPKMRCK